jgi:hypothetical protein
VRYAARLEPGAADRRLQRVHDELGAVVLGHRPADDLARGQVRPAGQIQSALLGGLLGEIADHPHPGPRRREVIRLVLLPVLLRLMGRAAWACPKWLARVLPEVRFSH